MHLIVLPDEIETAIRGVEWTVLGVFFVLAVLSWLVASREWKDETGAAAEESHKREG